MNWSDFKERIKALCYLDSTSPNPEVEALFDQLCQQVAVDLQTRIAAFQDGHTVYYDEGDANPTGATGLSFDFPSEMMTFESLRIERPIFPEGEPDAMVVEGPAGSPEVLGLYLRDGDFEGMPKYAIPSDDPVFTIFGEFAIWWIDGFVDGFPAGMYFYRGPENVATPDLVSEWAADEGGLPPAPTVRRATWQEMLEAGHYIPSQYRSRGLNFREWASLTKFIEAEEPCPQAGTAPCFVWSSPERALRSFVVLESLMSPGDRIALTFNGVRESFNNNDPVPFNAQAATVAHYFVRGNMLMNHHEKRLLGEQFMRRYAQERSVLYVDMKHRRESATVRK